MSPVVHASVLACPTCRRPVVLTYRLEKGLPVAADPRTRVEPGAVSGACARCGADVRSPVTSPSVEERRPAP